MACCFICCVAEPLEAAHRGTKWSKSSKSLAIDDSEEVETTAQAAAVQLTMDSILRDVLAKCCKKQVLEDEAGSPSIHT